MVDSREFNELIFLLTRLFICNFIETILKNFVKMHWFIVTGRHFEIKLKKKIYIFFFFCMYRKKRAHCHFNQRSAPITNCGKWVKDELKMHDGVRFRIRVKIGKNGFKWFFSLWQSATVKYGLCVLASLRQLCTSARWDETWTGKKDVWHNSNIFNIK